MLTTANHTTTYPRVLVLMIGLVLVSACSRGPVASLPVGNAESPVGVKTLTLEPQAWTPTIVGFGRFETAEKGRDRGRHTGSGR